MKQIILTRGLPASGKTTWAKKTIQENPNAYKRINKDDLRAMLDCDKWSPDAEKFVLKVRDLLIVEALKAGKHVIVDDTNFASKHEERIKQLVRENGLEASVIVKDFDADVEECIRRDLLRPKSVGERVIRKMHRDYILPKKEKVKHVDGLPNAIICDLDGTLALMNGRNPYDASTCEQDSICDAVYRVLESCQYEIIFVSGRTDEYREQTQRWLTQHGLGVSKLYMRKTGDSRKDSIVKEEIFRSEIEGKYNILFVLDDRNQVVDMWRSVGLTCFQVAEGDF